MNFNRWLIFIIVLLLLVIGFLFVYNSMQKKVPDVVAIKTSNISCSSLEGLEKDDCYLESARASKDSSLCSLINDVRTRGDCYLIIDGK